MKILLLSATSLLLASAVHAQVAPTLVVSGEEENAAAEQQLFPQLLAMRQLDGNKARSGQASFLLQGQAASAGVSSVLLPVQKGQQVTVEIYAHYAPASPHRWLVPVATAVAGSLVAGTMPTPMGTDGARPTSRKATPYLGLGTALAIPRLFHRTAARQPTQPTSGAYVEYKFYDQQGTLVSSQRQEASATAQTDWQLLQVKLDAPANGFVQLALGNATKQPVWFDDLQTKIGGSSTPVVADSVAPVTPLTSPIELARPDSATTEPLVATLESGEAVAPAPADAVPAAPAATSAPAPASAPKEAVLQAPRQEVVPTVAQVSLPTPVGAIHTAFDLGMPAPAPEVKPIPLPALILYKQQETSLVEESEEEDPYEDEPGEDDPTEDPGEGGPGEGDPGEGDPGEGDPTEDPGEGDPTEDPGEGDPTEDPGEGDPTEDPGESDPTDGPGVGDYDLHYPENPSDGDQYTYVDSNGNVFEFVYDSELGLWVFPPYITVAAAQAVQTTINNGDPFPFADVNSANTVVGSVLGVFDSGFGAIDDLPAIDIAAKSEYLLMKSVGAVLKGVVIGSAAVTTAIDLTLLIDHGYNPEYVIRFLVDALITALGFTAYGTAPAIILAALNADGAFDDLYKAARYGGYQGALDYIKSL